MIRNRSTCAITNESGKPEMNDKPSLLLHVCCAPCSPYVVETLRKDYSVTLYFYNPNIHPEEEYLKRLEELRRWAENIGAPLIEGKYEAPKWFEAVKGLEKEPERGARCEVCFELRLSEAARTAKSLGIGVYGTVLTVSPHKDAVAINRIGEKVSDESGVKFFVADWKKKEGFKKTTALGKNLGFYRQNYCGCVFSRRDQAPDEL